MRMGERVHFDIKIDGKSVDIVIDER